MTAEGSALLGFENERCLVSTTSYNFTAEKPTPGRRDKTLTAKILILIVSLFIAFILIGFIARRASSSHETADGTQVVVGAAALSGYTGVVRESPPADNKNVSLLLKHEPTYEKIVAQYLFNVTDTEKLILIWSDWPDHLRHDYNNVVGKKFCNYTRDKNMINSADAVVFRNVVNDDQLPDRTNRKQIWIFNHRKPDLFNFTKHRGSFNLSASYRFDSDVPHLYDYLWKRQENITDSQLIEKYIQSKYNAAKVAVFLTDCNNSEIINYIGILKQYIINLDCYCTHGMLFGNKKFEQPIDKVIDWFKKYNKDYMFYLAFEEKQCEYYITDQFFGALRYGVIPIVRGNKDIYEKLAPQGSYIHMDSWGSIEELAKYLKDLTEDKEKIVAYFKWKKTTTFSRVYWYQQLCNIVQGTTSEEIFTIDNINNKIGACSLI